MIYIWIYLYVASHFFLNEGSHFFCMCVCVQLNSLRYDTSLPCNQISQMFLLNHILWCRNARSQSCPFCRDSLKKVNPSDLWILTDKREVMDMATVIKENLRRLFIYVEKLPLVMPNSVMNIYDPHVKWLASHCCFTYGVFYSFCCSLSRDRSHQRWYCIPASRLHLIPQQVQLKEVSLKDLYICKYCYSL